MRLAIGRRPPTPRRCWTRPSAGCSPWACSPPCGSTPTASPHPTGGSAGGGAACARARCARCGWAAGVGFDQVRQEARLTGRMDRTATGWAACAGCRPAQHRRAGRSCPAPSRCVRNRIDEGPRHGFIYRAGADFEQPRLCRRPSLRCKSLLESERTLEETYDAIGGRAMVGVRWEPHSTLTLFPAYNLQAYWLNGPPTATAQTAPLALGCTEDPCFVLLSYLEQIDHLGHARRPAGAAQGALPVAVAAGGRGTAGGRLRLPAHPAGGARLPDPGRRRSVHAGRPGPRGDTAHRLGRPEDSAVTTRFYSGGSMWMRGLLHSPAVADVADPHAGFERPGVDSWRCPSGATASSRAASRFATASPTRMVVAAFLDFGTVTPERLPLSQLPTGCCTRSVSACVT